MPPLEFEPGPDFAQQLDQQDELSGFRDEFVHPEPNLIYLDGNSLGRLPQQTVQRMRNAVKDEWGKELIRGWNQGWYDAPGRLGDQIGRLLGRIWSSARGYEVDQDVIDEAKAEVAALCRKFPSYPATERVDASAE